MRIKATSVIVSLFLVAIVAALFGYPYVSCACMALMISVIGLVELVGRKMDRNGTDEVFLWRRRRRR